VSTPVPESPRGDAQSMPRANTVLIGMATALVTILCLHELRWLLGPVLLALVIVITVQPLRTVLDRHVPRWASFILCLLTVYGAIIGFLAALVIAMAQFARLVRDYGSTMDDRVNQLGQRLHDMGFSGTQADAFKGSLDSTRLYNIILSVAHTTLGVASSLALMLAVVLFLVIDAGRFPYRLADVATLRPPLVAAMRDFAQSTRRYLVVSTAFGLIVAVLDTVALEILGVPAPVLWGLVAFLTNYIPNIGFFIGLIPPAFLAFLDSGPREMVVVIIIYIVINSVIQSGIQPKIVGDAVGLATSITFLSVVFWSWVLGPVGAILAVPMSLLVRAFLVDADPQSKWLRPLVANEASPNDPPGISRRHKPHRRPRRTTKPTSDNVVAHDESPESTGV
jgi:AI-2 transport protein TqsA